MKLFECTCSNSSWKRQWKINRMTIDLPGGIDDLPKRREWKLIVIVSLTFVPQKSYLLDRDNGRPCSQIILEQSALDNGNIYGISPSFFIRILHWFSNGNGFAPSSNLFSRILFNVSWNIYRQFISLISSSIKVDRRKKRKFFKYN